MRPVSPLGRSLRSSGLAKKCCRVDGDVKHHSAMGHYGATRQHRQFNLTASCLHRLHRMSINWDDRHHFLDHTLSATGFGVLVSGTAIRHSIAPSIRSVLPIHLSAEKRTFDGTRLRPYFDASVTRPKQIKAMLNSTRTMQPLRARPCYAN